MSMRSVLFGSPRWRGRDVGETTSTTGLQLSRGLAVVAGVVAVICAWSVLAEPEGRWVAASCLALFSGLTVDLVTSPPRPRHVILAVAGLTVSWVVPDPTGSGGVFPGEVALPCALLACVGVFRGIRAWGWIAVAALASGVAIRLSDGIASFRGPVVVLELAMLAAAGALAAALHDTVRRADGARELILAELVGREVAERERAAEKEAVAVLHDSVSDALRLVRQPTSDPDQVRQECAAAFLELGRAARWQAR